MLKVLERRGVYLLDNNRNCFYSLIGLISLSTGIIYSQGIVRQSLLISACVVIFSYFIIRCLHLQFVFLHTLIISSLSSCFRIVEHLEVLG